MKKMDKETIESNERLDEKYILGYYCFIDFTQKATRTAQHMKL